MPCPCGLNAEYEACCGRFHAGGEEAPTAELLMRSRYCAFVKGEVGYLKRTTWPRDQKSFDEAAYKARSENSIWIGLDILAAEDGEADDTKGTVTFIARSMLDGDLDTQREKSLFKKKQGRWYYVRPLE